MKKLIAIVLLAVLSATVQADDTDDVNLALEMAWCSGFLIAFSKTTELTDNQAEQMVAVGRGYVVATERLASKLPVDVEVFGNLAEQRMESGLLFFKSDRDTGSEGLQNGMSTCMEINPQVTELVKEWRAEMPLKTD